MNKIKAAVYYAAIPPNNTNQEKPQILNNFAAGVKNAGDEIISHHGFNVVSSDVALIQGFVHEDGKKLPHLTLRKSVFDEQIKNNKKALIVDSNLFLYADPGNSQRYLRYSFNGVFPTTGFYFDTLVDPVRWQKISKNLKIEILPYRNSGNHVLICLQRHGGWSMRGLSVTQWLNETINKLRNFTQRPIVVRCHPNDKKIKQLLNISHKNVTISNNSNILLDLKNAWATIIYNSSPGIASIINGVPVFITDPTPQNSQSFSVSNTDLSNIENPVMPERQQWIEKISMCHWNFDELRSGEAWNFFKKFI